VDDYISALILGKLGKVAGSGYLDRDSMASYMNYLHDHTDMEIVRYFDTPEENVPLLRISSAIVRQVALMTDAASGYFAELSQNQRGNIVIHYDDIFDHAIL